MKIYLSKKELAETLNVSVRTIDNWMAQRLLPYIRVKRKILFRLSSVEKALERLEVNPTDTP